MTIVKAMQILVILELWQFIYKNTFLPNTSLSLLNGDLESNLAMGLNRVVHLGQVNMFWISTTSKPEENMNKPCKDWTGEDTEYLLHDIVEHVKQSFTKHFMCTTSGSSTPRVVLNIFRS